MQSTASIGGICMIIPSPPFFMSWQGNLRVPYGCLDVQSSRACSTSSTELILIESLRDNALLKLSELGTSRDSRQSLKCGNRFPQRWRYLIGFLPNPTCRLGVTALRVCAVLIIAGITVLAHPYNQQNGANERDE